MTDLKIVLASGSPRRRELLELMQIPYTVFPVQIDETFDPERSAAENVMRVAEQKAREAARQLGRLDNKSTILAADTTVVFENTPLGKPSGYDEAHAMLDMLQGKQHEVMTGFALLHGDACHVDCAKTLVEFAPISKAEISHYIETQKPFDKAGAYGIQDPFISCFIERITGCYYNVVGLPLSRIYLAMRSRRILDCHHAR